MIRSIRIKKESVKSLSVIVTPHACTMKPNWYYSNKGSKVTVR